MTTCSITSSRCSKGCSSIWASLMGRSASSSRCSRERAVRCSTAESFGVAAGDPCGRVADVERRPLTGVGRALVCGAAPCGATHAKVLRGGPLILRLNRGASVRYHLMSVVLACHVFASGEACGSTALEWSDQQPAASKICQGGSMIRAGFETTDPRTQTRTVLVKAAEETGGRGGPSRCIVRRVHLQQIPLMSTRPGSRRSRSSRGRPLICWAASSGR